MDGLRSGIWGTALERMRRMSVLTSGAATSARNESRRPRRRSAATGCPSDPEHETGSCTSGRAAREPTQNSGSSHRRPYQTRGLGVGIPRCSSRTRTARCDCPGDRPGRRRRRRFETPWRHGRARMHRGLGGDRYLVARAAAAGSVGEGEPRWWCRRGPPPAVSATSLACRL